MALYNADWALSTDDNPATLCCTPHSPSTNLTMSKNKRNGLPSLNTGGHRPATEGEGSSIVELGDMGDHIAKLKQVSLGTQKLVNLLVDQLQGLSGTIPVLNGFEIVCIRFHLITPTGSI